MTDQPLEVACKELAERLRQPDPPKLLDCREPEEHAIAHLPGAVLIPLDEIPDRLPEVQALGDDVVVYCHHGVRSARAAGWLRAQGLAGVRSLAGGIDAWSLQVDPSLQRY